MRINHNLNALNAWRNLGSANTSMGKSLEKLSSGLRINRAGDDAAGLAISEKMRAQIRGLDQATRNGQDGISMIQTAEGALTETHSILQRMRELAVQSANDTNVNVDRQSLQDEIVQLKEEIDRIGNTTEFNTQSLLKGDGSVNLDKTNVVSDANLSGGDVTYTDAQQAITISNAGFVAGDSITVDLNGENITVNFAADGAEGYATGEAYNVTENSVTVNLQGTPDVNGVASALKNGVEAVIAENSTLEGNYTVSNATGTTTITATGDFKGDAGYIGTATVNSTTGTATGTAAVVGDTSYTQATASFDFTSLEDSDAATTDANLEALVGTGLTINGQQVEFYNSNDGSYEGEAIGVDISDALYEGTYTSKASALIDSIVAHDSSIDGVSLSNDGSGNLVVTATEGGTEGNDISVADGGIQQDFKAEFQIGANQNQTMEVNIGDMRVDALGISDVDLTTREGAQSAIKTINSAIENVSAQRSELGAVQNRLEHTINNLSVSAENLTAAESRIRDVDMAREMMKFTRDQILLQSSNAMLAQANQLPQNVLSLLR